MQREEVCFAGSLETGKEDLQLLESDATEGSSA